MNLNKKLLNQPENNQKYELNKYYKVKGIYSRKEEFRSDKNEHPKCTGCC